MAGSEQADGSEPSKPQEAVEVPLAGSLSQEEASGAQPAGEHAAEPSKGEHADAPAPATAEDTAQQAQEEVARDSGAEDVKTPSAAARGRGKKGKGVGRSARKAPARSRGQNKRGAKEDQQDTDPEQEEDGGKEGGGLGRRRSSRAVKKVKTFADEFITGETAAKSREGTPVGSSPRDTTEAAMEEDSDPKQEEKQAVNSEASEESDEIPLLKTIKGLAPVKVKAEDAAVTGSDQAQEAKTPATRRTRVQKDAEKGDEKHEEAADADDKAHAEEAKTLRTRRKRAPSTTEGAKPDQATGNEDAAAEANADAPIDDAKSPKAKRGKQQETGQAGVTAEVAEAEIAAEAEPPKSFKRKRKTDTEQPAEQEDAPDQAAGTEGKSASTKRRRAKTALAQGTAAKVRVPERRRTKSREATPDQSVEASKQPAAAETAGATAAQPEQAPGQEKTDQEAASNAAPRSAPEALMQKMPNKESTDTPAQRQTGQRGAGVGTAEQQTVPAKTGVVGELQHIRVGLLKAEEAHDKKIVELRQLESQVKGYIERLSRMNITVEQLSLTGIGKNVKRVTRWRTQRQNLKGPPEDSASQHAQNLVDKLETMAGTKPKLASTPIPAGSAEPKQKQAAQSEQEAPKMVAPAQPSRAPPVQAAPQHTQAAQATPQPTPEAPQAAAAAAAAAAAGAAAAPVKREEPKVVAIGLKQELPAPLRKSQPSKADANHSTGSAVRDKALGILLHALAPDEALSPEEAANKLEAALYASCTNGKASGQPAEPGVTYMRRLKVLWSWLDGSSPYRSHGLKRLFIEGKLAAPELATMDARRARDLTDPPTASTASQPGSQQDLDGTPAGTAPANAEAPYANGQSQQQNADMDIDPPNQAPAVPGFTGRRIPVSTLPSQELLAKLQGFCEGSLQAPQPDSSHLQGFSEPPLDHTVREIIRNHEAALRACQAGQASADQLHGVIAAGRLLERSLGAASQPTAPQHQQQPLLAPEEAQLQLLPFAESVLAALTCASAPPGQQAPASGLGSSPLRTPLPPQVAAAMQHAADEAAALRPPPPPASAYPADITTLAQSAPSASERPMDVSSAPGQSHEGPASIESNEVHEESSALDLAAGLPGSLPQTPMLGSAVCSNQAPPAQAGNHYGSMAEGNHFANMQSTPGMRQGWRSEERHPPSTVLDPSAKQLYDPIAGVLHGQQSKGAEEMQKDLAESGRMSVAVDVEMGQGNAS